MTPYEEIARNQGLGPIMDGLTEAGITWNLWQSGGYVMIVTVNLAEGAFLGFAPDPPQGFNVCRYERDSEYEGEEERMLGTDMTLAEVVAVVQAQLAEFPPRTAD